MVRKRSSKSEAPARASGACVVCGMRDARALLEVELAGGARVVLCGSHELMHRRDGGKAESGEALRRAYGERRRETRRAHGEVDELAASLSAAFSRERRVSERRAG